MARAFVQRSLAILFVSTVLLTASFRPVQAQAGGGTSQGMSLGERIKAYFSVKESTKNYTTAIGANNNVSQEDNVTGAGTFTLNYLLSSTIGGKAVGQIAGLPESEQLALEKVLGRGLIGEVNRGIIATYNPPATTYTYVADLMESAKIIPRAQAQGLGFSALDPILETWKAFRNLAYLFFVVIFLVIGFMIMLRTKVGQAAITAQQAIPSVIIAMLAVTFSYAIAGLMIDLMYVIMYMMASFFSEGPDVITRNMLGLVGLMFQGTDGVQETIEQFMEDALNIGWLGEAIAWLSSLLGSVIVGVAVLIASFKVFFELIKTYVAVLVQIIFSPIILMFGALPGRNVFGKWIKDLAGNLIVWPVVLLCILVQRMLTAPIRALQGTGNSLDAAFGGGFMPPFLIGQGQGAILPVIVGLGVLLVIPEIIQQVKKAMGVEDGVFGQLAKDAMNRVKSGEVIAPVASAVGKGGWDSARAMQAYSRNADTNFNAWEMLKHGVSGYTSGKGESAIHYGGLSGGLKEGWDWGQEKIRVPLDRILDGRFLDAEDSTKMLSNILKGNNAGGNTGGGGGSSSSKSEEPVRNVS